MDARDIYDGVTNIRDDLIDGAGSALRKQKSRKKSWRMGAAAAVLALAVLGGVLFVPGNLRPDGSLSRYTLAQAKYPDMAPYPGETYTEKEWDAWQESIAAQRRDLGDLSSLQTFFKDSAIAFLSDGASSGTESRNQVYSPLNVYMALSMLAQLTDGESRSQILSLLGSENMDSLRRQANDIWNANYRDDGAQTSILASSLWLDQDIRCNQDTLNLLASDFYASSFQGKMGADAYNRALQEWLSRQTGGLLDAQAQNIAMDADTILALAATVYYRAKWKNEFNKRNTFPQTFHSPEGDMEVDFLFRPYEWENAKFLSVNKSIPKFDVSSQFDLTEGLQKLGVTDVFDPHRADFSPMTEETDAPPMAVSEANHAARVVIDEKGCTAAAFTVMVQNSAMRPPDDEADFVLDRPFLFCITGDSGLTLFVGVVDSPVSQ